MSKDKDRLVDGDVSLEETMSAWIEHLMLLAEATLAPVTASIKDKVVKQAAKAIAASGTGPCMMPLLCLNWRRFTPPGTEPSLCQIHMLKITHSTSRKQTLHILIFGTLLSWSFRLARHYTFVMPACDPITCHRASLASPGMWLCLFCSRH